MKAFRDSREAFFYCGGDSGPRFHAVVTRLSMDTSNLHPINIFSGAPGLGGALTNPTELSRSKGCIQQAYPVLFDGVQFKDAEAAYHAHKSVDAASNDALMALLIAQKFRQHPALAQAVARRGGATWLAACDHLTGARTERAQSWEGHGTESRFIRNLVAGYLQFEKGEFQRPAQSSLFGSDG